MDKIVHQRVILTCGLREAFTCFTENNALERWLTVEADVEPVPGGKYELFWDPDNREDNSTIGCRITAIETDQFLSFEWRSPEQFKHFTGDADPLTHVVVFFIPTAEGTTINLIHSGWRNSPEWEDARQWQERAWAGALAELARLATDRDTTDRDT